MSNLDNKRKFSESVHCRNKKYLTTLFYNPNVKHSKLSNTGKFRGYICYKTITSQNVSPDAQVKIFSIL